MRSAPLALLVCAVVVAAACQSPAPSVAPPTASRPSTAVTTTPGPGSILAADQVLRVDIVEPDTLDPTRSDGPGVPILRELHRTLVVLDDRLGVVPELARSWDTSDDQRTLTFHLRDARFSNGDPVVAGDFVYSWMRLADPRIHSPYMDSMSAVTGDAEVRALATPNAAPNDVAIDAALDGLGLAAPDDRTFVVHLDRPTSYFLSSLTMPVFAPLQKKWITGPNATEAADYVSSGPFILDRWAHDDQIVLKPNPNWEGEVKPTLTEIDMTVVNEMAQGQASYEAGEIDLTPIPIEDLQRIRADADLNPGYREVRRLAVNYESFNTFQDPSVPSYARPGPTANRDFRIALSQAIDKQALIAVADGGLGQAANSIIMPGIDGYQPDLDPYPYDLTAARQHMTVALKALGKTSAADLGKLKLGYSSGSGREPEVAFLAEAWRQAFGLETEPLGSDYSVFEAEVVAGGYDISTTGWGADYPHANNQLSGLFTCGGSSNDAKYCNPAFDDLLTQASAEPDHDRQVATYDEAQTLLIEDAPVLPVRFVVDAFEVRPYVDGFRVPGESYEAIRILKH